MKTSLILMLALATGASAYAGAPQQSAPPAGAAPQQQVTIKDPAEYNAYITAINQTDPAAKAQALEAFLQQYPSSVVKVDALELLMATYSQLGNAQKAAEAANKVLQADPNNLRALALLTYTNRACADQGGPNAMQCLTDAGRFAQQGLQAEQAAQKPASLNQADWDKLKTQTSAIFAGAAGMAALQQKNYPDAAKYLQEAVNAAPNDLRNVYPLALSYLQQKPQDVRGLFYIARAVNLAAGSPAQAQINAYGKRAYTVYHGSDDGWDQLVASTAQTPNPPADFQVKPAPTPAEQAATLVQTTPVSKMSFDQIQMVLTSGNQQAADQVFSQLKDKPIAIEGKVITATPTKLAIAGSYDDIQSNTPDIDLTMTTTIPAKLMPKEGQMLQFQGNPSSYDVTPFMMHMVEGKLLKAPGAEQKPSPAKKAPAKKAPVRKKQ
jgi:tetratricopeptide (TPR) repeat protein